MTTRTASKTADQVLRLERRFEAAPERVFDAFTKPEQLKQWWGPEGFTTPKAKLDVRAGGAYAIDMKAPSGEIYRVRGTFRTVERPKRLVYTWAWQEGSYADLPTLVTLEFLAKGKGTLLRITHEGMTTAEMVDDHKGGWSSTLERLAAMLAAA